MQQVLQGFRKVFLAVDGDRQICDHLLEVCADVADVSDSGIGWQNHEFDESDKGADVG